jgi:undecaprenyl-diphosphatase
MPPWLETQRSRSLAWDWACARRLHRGAQRPRVLRVFAVASRLGDAPTWLAVTFGLLLLGGPALRPVGWAALALGTLNLLLYWTLKKATRRERPYRVCDGIRAAVPAADPFSFPSGHTMHATAFAVLFGAAWPSLAPALGAFALLVALSRVVVGVHFPSDVIAGALIGAATAAGVVLVTLG